MEASMESLGDVIFGVGWPVLIVASIWLWRNMAHLTHTAKNFLNVALTAFYLLGYVCTLFWLGQAWYVAVLPTFVIFIVLLIITVRTAYEAGQDKGDGGE
jgi:CHASE2 domain-containing sensor protein